MIFLDGELAGFLVELEVVRVCFLRVGVRGETVGIECQRAREFDLGARETIGVAAVAVCHEAVLIRAAELVSVGVVAVGVIGALREGLACSIAAAVECRIERDAVAGFSEYERDVLLENTLVTERVFADRDDRIADGDGIGRRVIGFGVGVFGESSRADEVNLFLCVVVGDDGIGRRLSF